ncbi:2Fe-2S iron-sulfur cluster-binding protein [Pedobacter sp. P351]|uniref:2Fe-2S iron-sulfur cluster-binding protein n=1 Tax=Pedobacter superstes TaxID=3133441 RepID=UPI0030AE52C3
MTEASSTLMDKEKLLHFRIDSVKQENPLSKTYQLELLNAKTLNYKPGQFLTFIINTEKQEIRRSYSILSLPGEPLKITVKKVDNGLISRYILQYWKEGEIIKSLLPAGRFSFSPIPEIKRDIFCFAAGSGIIPVLPQIRMLLTQEPQSVIHLIYSNRNERDALFLEEIENLSKNSKNLNLINLFSEPDFRKHEQGRLSNINTETLINRLLKFEKGNAAFLLCGPFSYMRMLNFTIGLMHFKKENIRKENFLPEVMSSGRVVHQIFPETTVQIDFYGNKELVTVHSGENILDAALKQGLNLPYSCKGGVCGNCAAKCKSGHIYMSINEVLTDADIKEGWVLTCTGYPETKNTAIDFLSEQ